MAEARDVEIVVGEVAIGIDHRIQRYLGVYDGDHRCSRDVGQHLRVDPPAALEDAEHRHLAGSSTASFAFAPSAEVTLVDLDLASDGAFVFDVRALRGGHAGANGG